MSSLLTTALIILGPILFQNFLKWNAKRQEPPPNPLMQEQPPNTSSSTPPAANSHPQSVGEAAGPSTTNLRFIFWCLIVHEFVVAFEVLFNPPTNLFTALKVPVTAVASQLSAVLMAQSGAEFLPPHLTNLLNRLQSFDTRTYYIRFGHEAIVTCTHCRTLYDYLLVHLAKVSLEYIRLTGLIAVMTVAGSGKQRWRRWGLAAVIGAFAAEMWTVATVEVRIPRNGLNAEMLHDKIWYLRHTFLFLLPLILHFLPYSSASQSPFTLLHPVAIHLERIHARLSLFSLVHSAAQRNPELRNNAGQYWETMEKESTLGRESRDVKTEAERLGMGFEEKANGKAERRWKVREEASNIVDNMIEVGLALVYTRFDELTERISE
ncbi:hypothetical protein FRC05_010500 [Tulasnella sp. 425]|nr:hypothetical protein FRC05_010500 [Tulasnella sp. 425]